jgi:hypothetical protein
MPRHLLAGLIIAILLIVGGYALLGLPGGIYALVTAPIVELIRGLPMGSLLDGERAWPTAILMSMLVPLALPASMFIVHWLRPKAGWLEATMWVAAGCYLWAFGVLLWTSF